MPDRGQAVGARPRRFASELAFRQTVTMRVRDVDRGGHLVREMMLPDGRSLNRELVKAGPAQWYQ